MSESPLVSRILERAAAVKVAVSAEELAALDRYYRLLEHWNRRINLTALPLAQYPAETIDRLIIEPLAAGKHVADATRDWIDLGTGGGSPAIPLKISRPKHRLLMTESRGRKAAFLREAVRDLGLADAAVSSDRFEALGEGPPEIADLVTARAIKIDRAFVRLVRHVLRPSGQLLLFGYQESEHLDQFEIAHHGELPGRRSRFGLLIKR